jgi:hypothetical protein
VLLEIIGLIFTRSDEIDEAVDGTELDTID